MQGPITTLADRFKAMKIKEQGVGVAFAASEDEIKHALNFIQFLEPSIDSEKKMTSKIMKESVPLQDFITGHCNMSSYVFQIKKCQNNSCLHCAHHPVHMTAEEFEALSYLPLPLLDSHKDSYLPFDKVYGQLPSDKDQPSKGSYSFQEAKELDAKRKSLFTNSKVRRTIICRECFKPRCIYAARKLTKEECTLLEEIDYSKLYTCGSELFPPTSCRYDLIVTRAALICSDSIEVQYYSATLVSFPLICYFCGLPDGLVNDDSIKELRKQYAVVRPICFLCRSSGKRPATRQPNNMKKQKKN